MLPRVLEPEVMDDEEEARDYDAMDHSGVNARFCEDLLAEGGGRGRVLDVGTGTALIPIELARRSPSARVVAIDLADSMLALARKNVERANLAAAITIEKADAKRLKYGDGDFDCVMTNTILHHIEDIAPVLAEMARVTAKGGLVFARDLTRPVDEAGVRALVALYAQNDTERQRRLFEASLHASLTLDEARGVAERAGIPGACVKMTSDRHWTLAYRKS